MYVTHELGFSPEVAHRVWFIDAGEILELAEPEAFFGRSIRGLSDSCPIRVITDPTGKGIRISGIIPLPPSSWPRTPPISSTDRSCTWTTG